MERIVIGGATIVVVFALAAVGSLLMRDRRERAKRREWRHRAHRRERTYQAVWNMFFAGRRQRRLSYRPAEPE